MWCRLLDRSQTGCQQTQPKNSTCSATSRQESSEETKCFKAEQRQHEKAFIDDATIYLQCISVHKTQKRTGQFFKMWITATTLGNPSLKHQDWLDENNEEIKSLLETKRRLHKAHQDDTRSVSKKAAYSNICKTVQNRPRDMQDFWLNKKVDENQTERT